MRILKELIVFLLWILASPFVAAATIIFFIATICLVPLCLVFLVLSIPITLLSGNNIIDKFKNYFNTNTKDEDDDE